MEDKKTKTHLKLSVRCESWLAPRLKKENYKEHFGEI